MEINREEYMVDKYGECVTKTKAAQIIGRSVSTITDMLQDGRLDAVCGGTMVCVHSIARYIDAPKKADSVARARKAGKTWFVPREA